MNLNIDKVLLYKNQEGLVEAIFKSESPRLFHKLYEQNKDNCMSFSPELIAYFKNNVRILLWNINLNDKKIPENLELYLDPEAKEDYFL